MAADGARSMRLTPIGWAALLGAGVAIGGGRATGISELQFLGTIVAATLVVSALFVLVVGRFLTVERTVSPGRIPCGAAFTSNVTVRSRVPLPRLPFSFVDHIDGEAQQRLFAAPNSARGARLAFPLATSRRGALRIGPLTVGFSDPFGFATASMEEPTTHELLVLPRVVPVGAASTHQLSDQPSGPGRPAPVFRQNSDEFDALREYVEGDDIRLIHWASTARFGHPVIKQFEHHSARQTTVILDRYRDVADPAAFDLAIDITASLLADRVEHRDLVRFVPSGEPASAFLTTPLDLETALDDLATMSPDADAPALPATVSLLERAAAGDRAIVCAPALHPGVLDAATMLDAVGVEVIVVICSLAPSADVAPPSASVAASGASIRFVTIPDIDELAATWRREVDLSEATSGARR